MSALDQIVLNLLSKGHEGLRPGSRNIFQSPEEGLLEQIIQSGVGPTATDVLTGFTRDQAVPAGFDPNGLEMFRVQPGERRPPSRVETKLVSDLPGTGSLGDEALKEILGVTFSSQPKAPQQGAAGSDGLPSGKSLESLLPLIAAAASISTPPRFGENFSVAGRINDGIAAFLGAKQKQATTRATDINTQAGLLKAAQSGRGNLQRKTRKVVEGGKTFDVTEVFDPKTGQSTEVGRSEVPNFVVSSAIDPKTGTQKVAIINKANPSDIQFVGDKEGLTAKQKEERAQNVLRLGNLRDNISKALSLVTSDPSVTGFPGTARAFVEGLMRFAATDMPPGAAQEFQRLRQAIAVDVTGEVLNESRSISNEERALVNQLIKGSGAFDDPVITKQALRALGKVVVEREDLAKGISNSMISQSELARRYRRGEVKVGDLFRTDDGRLMTFNQEMASALGGIK